MPHVPGGWERWQSCTSVDNHCARVSELLLFAPQRALTEILPGGGWVLPKRCQIIDSRKGVPDRRTRLDLRRHKIERNTDSVVRGY